MENFNVFKYSNKDSVWVCRHIRRLSGKDMYTLDQNEYEPEADQPHHGAVLSLDSEELVVCQGIFSSHYLPAVDESRLQNRAKDIVGRKYNFILAYCRRLTHVRLLQAQGRPKGRDRI